MSGFMNRLEKFAERLECDYVCTAVVGVIVAVLAFVIGCEMFGIGVWLLYPWWFVCGEGAVFVLVSASFACGATLRLLSKGESTMLIIVDWVSVISALMAFGAVALLYFYNTLVELMLTGALNYNLLAWGIIATLVVACGIVYAVRVADCGVG